MTTPKNQTVTRFAPSPTGKLHIGNIRTALHNWLLAKKAGGRFLLRIDDTDAARSLEEHVVSIRADLAWLGLDYADEQRQSARFPLYEREFERLRAEGRVYRCYETAQELDLKRKVLLGRGLPPIYDRSALALTEADHAARAEAGEAPHWRFLLNHDEPITWVDGIRGPQNFSAAQMSDPVIRRADGSWLYMLPSVIDDIDMGVTQILRGEDHVSNTATQVQMFTALGAPVPAFAHEALLVGAEGKLSKRLGAMGMAELRENGIEPEAIIALLGRLGTSDPVDPALDAAALAASFDLSRFGRAPARFDDAELERVNTAILHHMPFAKVAPRLPAGMTAPAWEAIRANLKTVAEVRQWWTVITGPIELPEHIMPGVRTVAAMALTVVIESAYGLIWDKDDVWHALAYTVQDKLRETTGQEYKGKTLFQPLRLALTGQTHGPEMAALLPLIGREEAMRRLALAAGQ